LPPKDAAPEIVEISDDSDASEDEESKDKDEIDACVHCLFPGTALVSTKFSNLKTKEKGSSSLNRDLL